MVNKRILLVGELAIDLDVIGTCDRIAAEAPVVIQKPVEIKSNPGMAGNVKANLESLAPGIKIDFFHQPNPIYKIRHIDSASGYILLRVDDNDDAYDADIWARIVEGMAANPDGYSLMAVSDYCKQLISSQVIEALVEIAHELGITFWLDSKKILGEWSQNIDFVKINEKEFNAHFTAGIKDPWKWCRNLIVTRGKNGADLYDQNGNIIYHSDSIASQVFNVSGAGDTYFAALMISYLGNPNIRNSMDYANVASAVAVSRSGIVAVKADEVSFFCKK